MLQLVMKLKLKFKQYVYKRSVLPKNRKKTISSTKIDHYIYTLQHSEAKKDYTYGKCIDRYNQEIEQIQNFKLLISLQLFKNVIRNEENQLLNK